MFRELFIFLNTFLQLKHTLLFLIPYLFLHKKIKLFKLYQAGDLNAKEDIVNGNLKLVLSVLKNFSKTGINQDDLFQVGCIGLIKAIDNFDINQDVQFSTYRSSYDNTVRLKDT